MEAVSATHLLSTPVIRLELSVAPLLVCFALQASRMGSLILRLKARILALFAWLVLGTQARLALQYGKGKGARNEGMGEVEELLGRG